MKLNRRQWLPLLLCVVAVAAAAALPPGLLAGVMGSTLDSPVAFAAQHTEAPIPLITAAPTGQDGWYPDIPLPEAVLTPLPAATSVPEQAGPVNMPFAPLRTAEPGDPLSPGQEEDMPGFQQDPQLVPLAPGQTPDANLPVEVFPVATVPSTQEVVLTPAPTATPLPAALHDGSAAPSWVEQDPVGSPHPIPPADTSQVAPLDWRAGLQTVEEADARSRLQELRGDLLLWPPADQLDQIPLSAYTTQQMDQSDSLLLVESLMPSDLALQKLISGLLQNLSPDTIFVPDEQTLARFMDLPIAAISIDGNGEIATFLATNRQRLPLRMLQEARQQGHSPIGPAMYLDLRSTLLDNATAVMEATRAEGGESAWDLSLNIVGELMYNDSPWDLSVIRMEPYHSEADWEYYAAGHHVQAVDMTTGKQYTLTTDLLTGKVIGLASEGAIPWLKMYAQLVQSRRLLQSGDDSAQMYASVDRALMLLDQLIPDSTRSPGVWTGIAKRQMLANGQPGWEVIYEPEDSLARQLDPAGVGFPMYTVLLDNDLNLIHMYSQPQPIQSAEMRQVPIPASLSGKDIVQLVEPLVNMGISHGELVDVLNSRTEFAGKLLAHMKQNGWPVTLMGIESIVGNTWLPTEKHTMQHSVSLAFNVVDERGIQWRIEAETNVHNSTVTITSVFRGS